MNAELYYDEESDVVEARRPANPFKTKRAYSTRYERRRGKTPALRSGVHCRRIRKLSM